MMKKHTEPTAALLTPTVCEAIDRWIAKYPPDRQQSALLPALAIAQKANGGWLSEAWIKAIADYLQLSLIAVYEVVTFYTMFRTQPAGRHRIDVCTNISCKLNGADEIVAHLQKRLGIALGQTTPDGQFSLQAVECLAACTQAPMMMFDEHYHEHLTPEKIDALLAQYTQEKQNEG